MKTYAPFEKTGLVSNAIPCSIPRSIPCSVPVPTFTITVNPEHKKIVNRFNEVMEFVGYEYNEIGNTYSDIARECINHMNKYNMDYFSFSNYGCEWNEISIGWMIHETEYIHSLYFEEGCIRYEDRNDSPENYKIWKSESGRLYRLLQALKKHPVNTVVATIH